METQFLIGRSLLALPILEEGKTQRSAYFPGDGWFNLYTGEAVTINQTETIHNELTDLVPLFIRNGSLIFRQKTDNVTKTDHLS